MLIGAGSTSSLNPLSQSRDDLNFTATHNDSAAKIPVPIMDVQAFSNQEESKNDE